MSNTQQDPRNQQVNIELGEKEAEGIYSNLAIITHSNAEFVIDFTRILPGVPKAKVHARVVMTPVHAKLLLNALRDNIEKFERKFGEISIPQDPGQMFTGTPPDGVMH
ncbi:DUF3467 domain-containing protein [bacterium]|nr:DUF3467 domain-containing protein [bacterium]